MKLNLLRPLFLFALLVAVTQSPAQFSSTNTIGGISAPTNSFAHTNTISGSTNAPFNPTNTPGSLTLNAPFGTNRIGGTTNVYVDTNPVVPIGVVLIYAGTNTPNGWLTAGTGSIYNQFDTATNFVQQWVKWTRSSNSGWVAVAGGGSFTTNGYTYVTNIYSTNLYITNVTNIYSTGNGINGLIHFYVFTADGADSAGNGDLTAYTGSPSYGTNSLGRMVTVDSSDCLFGGQTNLSLLSSWTINIWYQQGSAYSSNYGGEAPVWAYGTSYRDLLLTDDHSAVDTCYNYIGSETHIDSTVFADGNPHMISYVNSNGTCTVYIDGTSAGSGAVSISAGNYPFCLGASLSASLPTDYGSTCNYNLSLFSVWATALTSNEITWQYNGGAGRTYSAQPSMP